MYIYTYIYVCILGALGFRVMVQAKDSRTNLVVLCQGSDHGSYVSASRRLSIPTEGYEGRATWFMPQSFSNTGDSVKSILERERPASSVEDGAASISVCSAWLSLLLTSLG